MRAKYLATNRPDQNRRSVPNDQLDPASRHHPAARPQSSYCLNPVLTANETHQSSVKVD
ncbi:putative protein tweety -like 3-like [Scophthalmus maximus]|uniref:Uncharacterized protein n=1 Tax=Scophthalmus maximus TaxID=52904 RepID=A0A2U9BMW3_SCOMX|nr:putative protein tweety -like 3-like [Scophthalmus maximus]